MLLEICLNSWDWQQPGNQERPSTGSLEASGPGLLSSRRKECSRPAATQKQEHVNISCLPSRNGTCNKKPRFGLRQEALRVGSLFGEVCIKQRLCPGDTKRRKPSPGPLPGLAHRTRGEIKKPCSPPLSAQHPDSVLVLV